MDSTTILLAAATITGLYVAWTMGAADVANAMVTSVGSGALDLRAALVVAAAFELGGAMLLGDTVTRTVGWEILDVDRLGAAPMTLALGMTCCLTASAVWLAAASARRWPVSTTHSIVGAIVGFGLAAGGFHGVRWSTVARITGSWAATPLLGGAVAFVLFLLMKRRVLTVERPLLAMRAWGPTLAFVVTGSLMMTLAHGGLSPLALRLPPGVATGLALGAATAAGLALTPVFRRLTRRIEGLTLVERNRRVERVFAVLQVFTAAFVAFAHGSNDVANAVGPLGAVLGGIGLESLDATEPVSTAILFVGSAGIVVGLATGGSAVMSTIGREIRQLTPSRGFVAELAAGSTIVLASELGLPVSTTHTLVGAVVGVGVARSLEAVDTRTLRTIAVAWLGTLPFTASLAAILFLLARPFL